MYRDYKMPVLSKPKLPLGIERIAGKNTPIVYADAEPEENYFCPICLDRLRWCSFIDLPCSHAVCTSCLLFTHFVKLKERGARVDFTCPLCRQSHKVSAIILDQNEPIQGIGANAGVRILHAVEDFFGNWIPVAIECGKGLYAIEALCGKKPPRTLRTFSSSQCCHINPYGGRYSKGEAPDRNPNLMRCVLSPHQLR